MQHFRGLFYKNLRRFGIKKSPPEKSAGRVSFPALNGNGGVVKSLAERYKLSAVSLSLRAMSRNASLRVSF